MKENEKNYLDKCTKKKKKITAFSLYVSNSVGPLRETPRIRKTTHNRMTCNIISRGELLGDVRELISGQQTTRQQEVSDVLVYDPVLGY